MNAVKLLLLFALLATSFHQAPGLLKAFRWKTKKPQSAPPSNNGPFHRASAPPSNNGPFHRASAPPSNNGPFHHASAPPSNSEKFQQPSAPISNNGQFQQPLPPLSNNGQFHQPSAPPFSNGQFSPQSGPQSMNAHSALPTNNAQVDKKESGWSLPGAVNLMSLSAIGVGLLSHLRGVNTSYLRGINTARADFSDLTPKLRSYIEKTVELCKPNKVHICDGSEEEASMLLQTMQKQGTIQPLPKYQNCWLARTNPADVARVESKTFLCSANKWDSVPHSKPNATPQLGNWISPEEADVAFNNRFPGCMKGRTMYVIPFSMGPVGSPLAKIGVEITDSAYVALSMRIMTRIGAPVLEKLKQDPNAEFIKALHSVGTPQSGSHPYPSWPCDPERTIIVHKMETNEILSYGSGYGGNSLLGKKCLALRIGSYMARKEGWLAEHMLILGITNASGKKRYIAAAFPSACGKTNLAMMTPTLAGYKVECVGDDIAWMKFNDKGELRAINPENGFFGVAPGTSNATNPIAMKTIFKNTMFTNTASTSDGGVYWEGLEKEIPLNVSITDWLGKQWSPGSSNPAAHPNSRFCSPANQCPIIDPSWEDSEGVPIDAILFGGRRPKGIPLVYESLNWKHGVFVGAAMRSEATAAAEYKKKVIMHDPFAMRPFFGYNFGKYLDHWLSLENRNGVKLPKIFHVNWFRKDQQGKFLWPGFGENSRVLDWIFRRIEKEDGIATETPIGFVPKKNALRLDGLKEHVDLDQLFAVDPEFWENEINEVQKYLEEQVGEDLPNEIIRQAQTLRSRLKNTTLLSKAYSS